MIRVGSHVEETLADEVSCIIPSLSFSRTILTY